MNEEISETPREDRDEDRPSNRNLYGATATNRDTGGYYEQ